MEKGGLLVPEEQKMMRMLAPVPDETPGLKVGAPSPQRKLWEFDCSIICRLLGLTFDEKELAKSFKKLQCADGQPFSALSASEMHGMLVHTCANPNPVSKYVDKMLRERFEPYRKLVEGLDQKEICELIEREGFKDIPLPALVWLAVRNQHKEIAEIESNVFSAIHIKERRALRLYDALSRMLPDGKVENVLQELKEALASNEELQRKYKRSEQKREQLRSEIETIKKYKSQVALDLAEQRQLNERLRKALEKLGAEPALEQIESLKKEIELLTEEIKSLIEELLKQELFEVTDRPGEPSLQQREAVEDKPIPFSEIEKEQQVPLSLEGIKVAFVGGLESLILHYRQVVECLGGVCDHCGGYSSSKKEIERLVEKADVVFCPVSMNSHSTCRCVKKACKFRNKPCYFLRSHSLSTFRRELVDFAKSLN